MEYARFLTQPDSERDLNDQAWQWLRETAKNDNPQAMLLVGNLYARGTHVHQRLRRAKTWLKRAAEAAPDNANLVNEVAWTLTVAHLRRLRDARYALRIMDRVMADEDNPARRTPAYLDTWAAAHAANGDFERAIAVQEEAIQQATRNQDPSNQLPILRKHLDAFRAGEQINEIPGRRPTSAKRASSSSDSGPSQRRRFGNRHHHAPIHCLPQTQHRLHPCRKT